MRKLLCQVCAGPADQTDDGVLWLLQDHRHDWPNWPEHMGVTEPPICLRCIRTSVRLCPALRRGYVAVRARQFAIAGVHGALYARGQPFPFVVGEVTLTFDDPRIPWIRAASLVRELQDCTIAPFGKSSRHEENDMTAVTGLKAGRSLIRESLSGEGTLATQQNGELA